MVVTTGDKKGPILASSEYGPGMLNEFPKVYRTQDAHLHPHHRCLIEKYPALASKRIKVERFCIGQVKRLKWNQ